ncbi:hypothetical protein ABIA35_003473 [Catenulispora sp. MAP12-49]|uniref:hypothetical protein n=1 Tax=unclassified Catenulispora TaxID=414885 RepID=UPI003519746B
MRADSFAGQVVAVLSRRTPAFQPVEGESSTFAGYLKAIGGNWRGKPELVRLQGSAEGLSLAISHAADEAEDAVRLEIYGRISPMLADLGQAFDDLEMGIRDVQDYCSARRSGSSPPPDDYYFGRVVAALNKTFDAVARARTAMDGIANVIDGLLHSDDLLGIGPAALEDVLARIAVVDDALDVIDEARREFERVGGEDGLDPSGSLDAVLLEPTLAVLTGRSWTAVGRQSRKAKDAIDRTRAALSDFAGADLRSADLSEIEMSGVIWNSETNWPSEWEDYLREISQELEPGLYRVTAGSAALPRAQDRWELEP